MLNSESVVSGIARPPTVLHVSESFAGGVSAAIHDYMRATPEWEHHLIYAPRDDAPLNAGDLEGFASAQELPVGHVQRIRAVRRIAQKFPDAVVHAHSSFGGAYVRAAIRRSKRRPIIYTPHCFGFERKDLGPVPRAAIWLVEALLALNTSSFAACSPRELRLSRWWISRATGAYVPNIAHIDETSSTPVDRERLTVAGAGRLGAQKDPLYFAQCAKALSAAGVDCEFIWIGGGDEVMMRQLEDAGVQPTGWLTRDQAVKRMASVDLYLHTAAWEGFPIAVLEAVTIGIPTVVRNIPAFDEIDLPAKIQTPNDLVDMWPRVSSVGDRAALASRASEALAKNRPTFQRRALVKLYRDKSVGVGS